MKSNIHRLLIFNCSTSFYFIAESDEDLKYICSRIDVSELYGPDGDLIVDNCAQHVFINHLGSEITLGKLKEAKDLIDGELKKPTIEAGSSLDRQFKQLRMLLKTKEILATDTFSSRLIQKTTVGLFSGFDNICNLP